MKWVEIKKLPPSGINKDGSDLGCLAIYKKRCTPDCGFDIIVSNREYVRKHPKQFTHWMPLPKKPQ